MLKFQIVFFYFSFIKALCVKRRNEQDAVVKFFSTDWLSFCLERLDSAEVVKGDMYICVAVFLSKLVSKSSRGYITLIAS